jgi:hypothetical protein
LIFIGVHRSQFRTSLEWKRGSVSLPFTLHLLETYTITGPQVKFQYTLLRSSPWLYQLHSPTSFFHVAHGFFAAARLTTFVAVTTTTTQPRSFLLALLNHLATHLSLSSMTNKKKRRRGKKDTSSSKEHNSRQEMRRADWLRLVAEREDPSRIRDGLRPQRDVDYQTNVRDVVRAEDTLFKQSWEYDTVDFGGQALNFSPSEREAQSALRQVRRKRPSSYWSKILYLDGAEGRQGERLDSDEYHQPEHHISGRPAGSQQVDPGFHPDRTVLVKQNLLDQVTEGLKATCVVSARSVADLLAHGFNVPRPPPPPPKADPGSQVQATSPPPIGALPNPFKQLSVFGSFAPPDQLTTPEAEAESPTKEDMSPGILIPRNAGIKLRSVEEEPPLVHVPAPDKSKIVVASQFLFQHDLEAAGMMDERNVQGRLQGIQVIEVGRRGLRM